MNPHSKQNDPYSMWNELQSMQNDPHSMWNELHSMQNEPHSMCRTFHSPTDSCRNPGIPAESGRNPGIPPEFRRNFTGMTRFRGFQEDSGRNPLGIHVIFLIYTHLEGLIHIYIHILLFTPSKFT